VNPEKFLNSLINYEKIPGYNYNLNNYRKFLQNFSSPQEKLRNVINIAGTKGKGSTAAIISSCLRSCGYRVGLFTSPHLSRINERIKINNNEISNRDLARCLGQIKPYIKGKNRARTFFEVLTTVAFLHFIRKKTDFSILETGLGGRLDTTSITNPILSVITRIGYDHTDLLGNKLSQIAAEKAGIIKPDVKLITKHQRSTAQRVISRAARAKNASIVFAEDQHKIKILELSKRGTHVNICGDMGRFSAFLPLTGQHHLENLLIALSVLSELRKLGYTISTRAVRKGIRNIRLRGRFDIISKNPLMIFDGAHNQDSFEALYRNLDRLKIRNFTIIFGSNRNKDIQYCLKYIFPRAKEVLLVQTDNPRARDPLEIYQQAKKYQNRLVISPSMQTAINYAKNRFKNNTAIVITGSFYLWPLSEKYSGSRDGKDC